MVEALLQLLNENEFQNITITQICEIAKVNRSTFYAHYQSTRDLLNETKNLLIDNFLKEYEELSKGINYVDMDKLKPEESIFINNNYLLPYLSYIKTHKHLYKIYHNNSIQFGENDNFQKMMNGVITPVFSKFGISDKKVINYMANYYLNGIIAIINEWVNDDCNDDIEFISSIINLSVGFNNK